MDGDMRLRSIPKVEEILPLYTDALREAFPDVDPGIEPFGYLVLLQLRTPQSKSKGGLILTDITKDTERYRVQTGLVRGMGPSAFRNRQTGEEWIEKAWCAPGDFVRCPMY